MKKVDLAELRRYLEEYRRRLEIAWTTETASPNCPWALGKPRSTGQCSASSLVLAEDLQVALGPLDLQLVTGTVWDVRSRGEAIKLHVWLILYQDDLIQPPWIIDLTGNQSPLIDQPVRLAQADELLSQSGLAYVAYSILGLNTAKSTTRARAAILRQSLEAYS